MKFASSMPSPPVVRLALLTACLAAMIIDSYALTTRLTLHTSWAGALTSEVTLCEWRTRAESECSARLALSVTAVMLRWNTLDTTCLQSTTSCLHSAASVSLLTTRPPLSPSMTSRSRVTSWMTSSSVVAGARLSRWSNAELTCCMLTSSSSLSGEHEMTMSGQTWWRSLVVSSASSNWHAAAETHDTN